MRAVLQRVQQAQVVVDEQTVGAIEQGLLVLLAITHSDTELELRRLADKIISLRLFPGTKGRFDRSLSDGVGAMLVVSQFTLYAETRKGRRPSWAAAAPPEQAAPMVEQFCAYVRQQGVQVASGQFGAHMDVQLVNDGPVTLILDTAEWSTGRG